MVKILELSTAKKKNELMLSRNGAHIYIDPKCKRSSIFSTPYRGRLKKNEKNTTRRVTKLYFHVINCS